MFLKIIVYWIIVLYLLLCLRGICCYKYFIDEERDVYRGKEFVERDEDKIKLGLFYV